MYSAGRTPRLAPCSHPSRLLAWPSTWTSRPPARAYRIRHYFAGCPPQGAGVDLWTHQGACQDSYHTHPSRLHGWPSTRTSRPPACGHMVCDYSDGAPLSQGCAETRTLLPPPPRLLARPSTGVSRPPALGHRVSYYSCGCPALSTSMIPTAYSTYYLP